MQTLKSKLDWPGQAGLNSRQKHSQRLSSKSMFAGQSRFTSRGHMHSHDGGIGIWKSPLHVTPLHGPLPVYFDVCPCLVCVAAL